MQSRKRKSQPWQRLASLDDLAMMLPNIKRHSTPTHASRKQDAAGCCPVCNSRHYQGKRLSLSLGGGVVSASVCEPCHAAASLSAGFGVAVAHRLYQLQQYAGGHHHA